MSKSWLQFFIFFIKKYYTCISRLFIAVHVLYYDAMFFWVWYNYGALGWNIERAKHWIFVVFCCFFFIKKNNFRKLKQTTKLSKLKSIKMHALFEHFGDYLKNFRFSYYQCCFAIKICVLNTQFEHIKVIIVHD